MKASLKWLKEYVEINVPVEVLAEKLIMNGLEVEGWENKADQITGVVVGKITAIEKHPDADKLQVCQIDVGGRTLQIVTGAQNVFVGAFVPAALNGACLKDGMKIKDSKLRGVDSFGMLCSGEELELAEEDYPGAGIYGIMILQGEQTPGIDIWKAIGLDDTIIEFKGAANRPDCQCIIGLARETAIALDQPLKMPAIDFTTSGKPTEEELSVTVQATDLCPRYIGHVVRNVRIGESPEWLKERLASAGVRAISNIVDITNYVMLETGQPMHAFDLRYVQENKIIVRRAQDGETITTLDEKERSLTGEMLVIADAQKPVALAGIMGGQYSGIMDDTSTVVFESAKFRRDCVRRTSRVTGLRTESSMRFEKGVDIANTRYALDRALHLVQQLNAGDIAQTSIDVCAETIAQRELRVSASKINALLGLSIPVEEMATSLRRLFIPTQVEGDTLICSLPSFREDIEGQADIAEEILRIYGYDKIETKVSLKTVSGSKGNERYQYRNFIKDRLAALGMYETATFSFVSDKALDNLRLEEDSKLRKVIRVANPLGEDQSIMRTTLAHSLLTVVATNTSRKLKEGRLFETGSVYLPKALPLTELPDEVPHLALACFGGEESYLTLKGIIEELMEYLGVTVKFAAGGESFYHPFRKAQMICRNSVVGELGEIHPEVLNNYGIDQRVYFAEIDLSQIYPAVRLTKTFRPLPKFPAIERDIAVVLEETVELGPVMDAIRSAGGAMLEDVSLFDIFTGAQLGAGKKSAAFALSFRSPDRTLVDTEVNALFDKILERLKTKFNAQLR